MNAIVITGGPCAGKTTALKHIRKALSQKGYRVFCVSETATELINGGITPDNSPSHWHFQYYLSQIQRVKESVFKQRANQDNDIIICDRGLLDNKGYLSQEDFQRLCEVFDTTQEEIIQRYDAIFHLETTAKGKEEHYERIQELAKKFEEKNGTIVCRNLLGLNVQHDSPKPEARTNEYYKKRPCAELVGDAAEILEEYIL